MKVKIYIAASYRFALLCTNGCLRGKELDGMKVKIYIAASYRFALLCTNGCLRGKDLTSGVGKLRCE